MSKIMELIQQGDQKILTEYFHSVVQSNNIALMAETAKEYIKAYLAFDDSIADFNCLESASVLLERIRFLDAQNH